MSGVLITHGVAYLFAGHTEGNSLILAPAPPQNKNEAERLIQHAKPPRLLRAEIGSGYDFVAIASQMVRTPAESQAGRLWWIVSLDPVVLARSSIANKMPSGPYDLDGRAILSREFSLITNEDFNQEADELLILAKLPDDSAHMTSGGQAALQELIRKGTQSIKLSNPTSLGTILSNPETWKSKIRGREQDKGSGVNN